MDERLKFVGEYLKEEESMSSLCRSFGISRKTGYKLVNRYRNDGMIGLEDRSKAPHSNCRSVSVELEEMILAVRASHPRWGPRKLRAWLLREHPRVDWPSASSIGRILKRHGKIVPRGRRRRCPPYTEPFGSCEAPNSIWCADFKGWFRTADGKRCEPLTVTDAHTRYLLACRALSHTTQNRVRTIFEAIFRQYGLPSAIRTDNGRPFASTALAGLSRLSVWWIRLGIRPERIDPGHPEQNGRHERFHKTLKDEAITPPKKTFLEQQRAFDSFSREYNTDRPHESLEDRTPGSLYEPSGRPYPAILPEITYPDDMIVRKVRPAGSIQWKGEEIYISETLVGEPVAFEQIDERYFKLFYSTIELAKLDDFKNKLVRPPVTRRNNVDSKHSKVLPMF